jgi:hypothetical protein
MREKPKTIYAHPFINGLCTDTREIAEEWLNGAHTDHVVGVYTLTDDTTLRGSGAPHQRLEAS